MNREAIGTGRLPAPCDCQAIISANIGVDLPMPEKPTLAAARCGWFGGWHLRYLTGIQRRQLRGDQPAIPVCCLRPGPRQHRCVVPAPSTADPAPRGCWAAAAAQRAHAAAAPDKRPAAP